jgi:hypothetical protein
VVREGGVQLATIEVAREVELTLESTGGLKASDGHQYELRNAYFEGKATGLFFESLAARMEFFGYAQGTAGRASPAAIAVFCNDRYLTSVGLNLAASSLGGRYLLDGREGNGFVLTLPIEEVEGTMRFFALGEDGVASELRYERRILSSTEYNGPFAIEP